MQFDRKMYQQYIYLFEKQIKKVFKNNAIFQFSEENYNNRGSFKIGFTYICSNYDIIIENEFCKFNIKIYDKEGASTILNRIAYYDGSLNEENIIKAIFLLKEILKKMILIYTLLLIVKYIEKIVME